MKRSLIGVLIGFLVRANCHGQAGRGGPVIGQQGSGTSLGQQGSGTERGQQGAGTALTPPGSVIQVGTEQQATLSSVIGTNSIGTNLFGVGASILAAPNIFAIGTNTLGGLTNGPTNGEVILTTNLNGATNTVVILPTNVTGGSTPLVVLSPGFLGASNLPAGTSLGTGLGGTNFGTVIGV